MECYRFVFILMLLFSGCLQNSFAQFNHTIYSTVLNQRVNDLIYSPQRRLIYASVPSNGATNANCVVAINPYTRQVINSVLVGSEPNKLALSNDGQFLYVGLDGIGAVRRVILNSFTADIQFFLGSDNNGLFYAEDMEVLPNNPNAVVISRRNFGYSPRFEGVAVFENGVMRPNIAAGHTGSNVIEFGNNPQILYGLNNETTDFSFREMVIDSNGVSVQSITPQIIFFFDADIKFAGNRIYTSAGHIIDPVNKVVIGRFTLPAFIDGFTVDAKSKRAFFLRERQIGAFNVDTLLQSGVILVGGINENTSKLIRWGRRGLAFKSEMGQVGIVETSIVPSQPNFSDFNGDELADYAVFRPNGGLWYATTDVFGTQFGIAGDIPVASDYDGDNRTDLAVFRNGIWYVYRSYTQSYLTVQFGLSGDKPLPFDFDGDQKTDFAVYRNGIWYVLKSSDENFLILSFGLADDIHAPSDYDGDGKTDFAVYRPGEGIWYILTAANYSFSAVRFGSSSAKPAPADYDGDGLSDIAVWQNVFGYPAFYVLQSKDNQIRVYVLNAQTDGIPVPLDFDGDSKADPTVFDQNGTWVRQNSGNGAEVIFNFGIIGDIPIKP